VPSAPQLCCPDRWRGRAFPVLAAQVAPVAHTVHAGELRNDLLGAAAGQVLRGLARRTSRAADEPKQTNVRFAWRCQAA
jgi:hypothetical protein